MRWLRTFLLALLLSLLVGLAIGTLLRLRLERPTRYIGTILPLASLPLDVCDAGTPGLDPSQHEEQVG